MTVVRVPLTKDHVLHPPVTPINKELRWCDNCGEGVTFFCRSKAVCECPNGLDRIDTQGAGNTRGEKS